MGEQRRVGEWLAHASPSHTNRAKDELSRQVTDDDAGVDGEGRSDAPKLVMDEIDWLDPSVRHAASLAPPLVARLEGPLATNEAAAVRGRSLEELLPALVRRIAWAGDKQKGTVRLELGAGAYVGTTVVVHADAGRVRVEIGGNEGPDLERLRARLDARLRGHGLDVESVT
jgi:hypothetical protein